MSSVEVIRGKENVSDVPFKAGMRLLHAVTKAGGLTGFGRQKVIVVRDDETLGEYDLSRSPPGEQNNPQLEPGDLIIIPDE